MARDAMSEPFINQASPDNVQLYRSPKEAIPFLAISPYEGKVIFQIPGSGGLEVDPWVALQFAQRIIELSYQANDHRLELLQEALIGKDCGMVIEKTESEWCIHS